VAVFGGVATPHTVDWLGLKGFIVHWLAFKGFMLHFSIIPRRRSASSLGMSSGASITRSDP
jgi:hypothetical protein